MDRCKKYKRKWTACLVRRFSIEVAADAPCPHVAFLGSDKKLLLFSGFHNRGEAESWISGVTAPPVGGACVGVISVKSEPEPSLDSGWGSAAIPSNCDASPCSSSDLDRIANGRSPAHHSCSELSGPGNSPPIDASFSILRRIMDATGESATTALRRHCIWQPRNFSAC